MTFVAKARNILYSPYKLRSLVNVIRGQRAQHAVAWLMTYKTRRTQPILKVLQSAIANARNKDQSVNVEDLVVSTIMVDGGKIYRYFKPSAQGRAMPQRRRTCHISVELNVKN
jgi:large subunit ribosomal protein L22